MYDQFNLWNAETGQRIGSERTRQNMLVAMAWPSDGKGLAVIKAGSPWGPNSDNLSNLLVGEFSGEKVIALPKAGPGGPPRVVVGNQNAATDPACNSIAISADGKRIAVATSVGANPDAVLICAAKVNTRVSQLKVLTKFAAPPMACTRLAFSPNGDHLVGMAEIKKVGKKTEGYAISIWNKEGKIARTVDVPLVGAQGNRLAFAVSNTHAGVGLEDGNTMIVDLKSGKTQSIGTKHISAGGSNGYGTFAVAFSPDGKTIASTGRDGMVRVSDIASGKVLRSFGRHASWPEALAYSPDGRRLASGGQDCVIRVWDPATGKDAAPTGGLRNYLWRLSISTDGKTLVTDGYDQSLSIWDTATGTVRRRIETPGAVSYCGLSSDGRQVVAVVGELRKPTKTLKVWDASTGTDATPPGLPKAITASGFRFSPDGRTLLIYQDEKIGAWAWPTGKKVWATEMPKPVKSPGVNQVQSVSFSPDGRHFITVAERYWFREEKGLHFGYGADGVVDLFETATGNRVRRLVEAQSCFRPGVYLPDGMYLHNGGGQLPGSSAQSNARMFVVDPLTGRLVREFGRSNRADGIEGGFTLALSADGKVLFRPTDYGEVHLYEVATGSFRTAVAGHRDMVLSLAVPNDVRHMVSGSKDTTALLWDVGLFHGSKQSLTVEERNKAWEALTDPDGKNAYEAMAKLARDSSGFVELARSQLKPALAGPSATDLAPIFHDLDSKSFAKREAASAALEKHGEAAMAIVRRRLETEKSAEARERLLRFLEKLDGPKSMPERWRRSRAVELLEHLGTPEAKALLEKLAKGGPARLTTDAASAVRRLISRK